MPPAARGDVERAARAYDAVLLIDGVFHHDLAPSPKECYTALAARPDVRRGEYGRAARRGVRALWIRSARDHRSLVCLRDASTETTRSQCSRIPQTHEALTVPMVNVRFVARLRSCARSLDRGEHDALCAAREVFYMERTWGDVGRALPAHARAAFAAIAQRAERSQARRRTLFAAQRPAGARTVDLGRRAAT